MITSTANERIKTIRKLRDRKFRDLTKTAYVEGIRQVIEAIRQGEVIETLIVTNSFLEEEKNIAFSDQIKKYDAPLLVVTQEVFKSFSIREGPAGVAAVIKQKAMKLPEYSGNFDGVWVCLWEIADPGNLGTILRTMDAIGAKGLILGGNCTDPYDPASIRASMGGIFSKTLVKSTLDEMVSTIKNRNIQTIGTSDLADTYYRDIRYPEDVLLIMGSERQGIPLALSEQCTSMVSLPMMGGCDSLNLAVATGVILYEILDQKRTKTGNQII